MVLVNRCFMPKRKEESINHMLLYCATFDICGSWFSCHLGGNG